MKKYKIGTRGSLLALGQSSIMKEELEKLTGDSFQLINIKTEGDIKTDLPLWQMEGKDFFTKELDFALKKNEVDLVVHSCKDLGTDRPKEFKLAAITKRSFSEDILLIKQNTIDNLSNLDEIIVGTSSPRRIENISKNLQEFLPFNNGNIKVAIKNLRGNVNTRIQKLKDNQYHAIVLALAGLERLASREDTGKVLKELLEGLNYMVLPQSYFTSSAAQGALAIEMLKDRDDDGELLKKIQLLNDKNTQEEVGIERKIFNDYGGGCHLPIGINVRKTDAGTIQTERGILDKKEIFTREILNRNKKETSFEKVFIGLPHSKSFDKKNIVFDRLIEKKASKVDHDFNAKQLFITSSYCVESIKETTPIGSCWVSGNKTWKSLAKTGRWVNGSTDGLGHKELERFKKCRVLTMTNELNGILHDQWCFLSAVGAKSNVGEIFECYERSIVDISDQYIEELRNTKVFYWTSFPQYQIFCKNFEFLKGSDIKHCCGVGKTYTEFKKANIKTIPFVSLQEFRNWIKD